MIALVMLAIVLTGAMAVLAYTLAVYALPAIVAVAVARFAYATGAGIVGAGIVGLLGGVAAFGLMAFLFATLRSPVLRLAVAIAFALPAAVAGYSLVHGVTRDAVPSEIWRQFFCIVGGIFVGCSALARLADPSIFDQDR
jgi:hypothetical protein